MFFSTKNYFFLSLVFLFLASCSTDDDSGVIPEQSPNLSQALDGANLTSLAEAINAIDELEIDLVSAPAITVFAPTNEAFDQAIEAYEVDTLNQLIDAIGGLENLETLLGFHVIPTVAFSSSFTEGVQSLATLSDQEITIIVDDSGVQVADLQGNSANVTTVDIEIENGVVHIIDQVLLPEFN